MLITNTPWLSDINVKSVCLCYKIVDMKKEYFSLIPIPRNVFSIFVTLNVMGYDDENNPRGMSPIRMAIRKKVVASGNWKDKYPEIYKNIKANHFWHLLNKILNRKKTGDKNNFLKELHTFSKEHLVQEAWKKFQIYEKREFIKIDNSSMRNEISRFLSYIGRPNKKINKIKIILNPLDAYWRGYGLKIGNNGYIVAGPGMDKNNYELIRHEILHLFYYSFRIPAYMTYVKTHKKIAFFGYVNSKMIREEYIVRALNLLYEKDVLKKDIRTDIKKEGKNFPYLNKVMALIK